MPHASLLHLFPRDLAKLKAEIAAYRNEADLWLVRGEIANSAGNLALHLVGNLNHFIGAILGQSGYVRERDLEFSRRDVPRAELQNAIDQTIVVVTDTLEKMPAEAWLQNFPVEKHGETVTTEFMLLHLLTHLNYHLGQVNYHRRLIEATAPSA